jgi:hypothetical protein
MCNGWCPDWPITCLTRVHPDLGVQMLVYGTPQQREKIISRFYGSVRKLIKHRHAAAVLALA